MSQTAVLVWLSATSINSAFRADLDDFAARRLLRLEAPRANAASFRAAAYAPDVVAQTEILLEEARNAAASLEQSRALSALEHVDRLLREHPELPQSAWLMAEKLELTAEVEGTAPEGTEAAAGLRKAAAVLEGARAVPFSDHAASSELETPTPHAVSVEGLEPGDTLEWDGVPTRSQLATPTGEHHARVARSGRLLWAGWLQVTDGESRIRLPVPETVPCSPDDLGAARLTGGRALPSPRARCDSYVLAQARLGGGIEVAICEQSSCGQVVIWQRDARQPARALVTPWPRWATYTIIGSAVGALGVTGLALWQGGVFDRQKPAPTVSLVYAGEVKPMGIRF